MKNVCTMLLMENRAANFIVESTHSVQNVKQNVETLPNVVRSDMNEDTKYAILWNDRAM